MGKFDGWLICTDFDGTVYVHGKISPENQAAIEYFQANGGKFTFSSGRFAHMFDSLVPQIRPNAPIVSMNGALINDTTPEHNILFRGGIRDVPRATEYCFALYDREPAVTGITYHSDTASVRFDRKCDQSTRADFIAHIYPYVSKMIVHVTTEDSDRMLSFLREDTRGMWRISRSWPNGIEMNEPGDGKGEGVLRVKEMTGSRHLVCVGDYENDLDMIEAADIGYAVGSAVPALKAAADRVTVNAADHAMAAIIRELEEEIDAGKYEN